MGRYTPILTELGSQLILDSLANGTNITLKYFAWGDSNGFQTPPNPIQTTLIHEIYRKEIDYVFLDPNMTNWLDILTIIPSDVGGFFVREVGIFTQDGSLFAVAEHPEFYKSIPTEGTTIEFKEKFIIKIGSLTEVNITLNPMLTMDASNIGNGSVSNEEFQYLDGVISPIQPQLDGKVNRIGDTMTGNLTIPVGTLSGHAVNKGQLDTKVSKSGDTMTGNLTIPVGTELEHAVNKGQLDTKVSKSGDTMTGNLTIPAGTLSGHAVNLGQLGGILESKLPPTFLSGLTLSNSNAAGSTEIIAIGNTTNKVYRSIDNGVSWDLGVPIPTEISNSAVDSVTQLLNGDMLATGNVTQLIYRSTDKGYTWTSGTKVDPSVSASLRGIVQLINGDILATGFSTNKVYRSIDNGSTWDTGVLVRTGAGLQNITQLANGYVLTTGDTTKKVYTSMDNGVTWSDGVLVSGATSLSNIVQTKDGPILVLARLDHKVYKSTDIGNLGTTWDTGTSISVPTGTSIHGLCRTVTGDILVSGNGDKVFRSLYPSNGTKWDTGSLVATGSGITSLVQVRTSSDTLSIGYQSDSIHRSNDQGINWDTGNLVEYGSGLDSMVQLIRGELLVTGSTSNKVYKSIDNGETWDSGVFISDASSMGGIVQLFNGDVLVTDKVSDKVYKSMDDGATWDSGVLIENLVAISPNTQIAESDIYSFSINGDVTSQIPDHSTVKMQGGSGIEYTVSATYDGISDTTSIFRDDSLEIDPIDRALYSGGTLLKKSTNNSIRGIIQISNGNVLATGKDSDKVYKSFDNGTTWDTGTLVATGAGLIGIVQMDSGDLVTTGVLSKKVYRSRNNGLNWSSGVSSHENFSLGDILQLFTDSGIGIDISAGKARSDDDMANIEFTNLSSSFKTLDSIFTEGSGNGGLDEGIKTINTWYHVYVISKSEGTSDILFSQNAISPIMPVDFLYQRRVGSILTDLYGNIVKFQQRGDKFYYLNSRTDYSSSTPSGSWVLLPLGTPYGIRCEALMNISVIGGASKDGLEALIYVKPTFMNSPQNYVGIYPSAGGGGDDVGGRDSSSISIFTDTASRIHRKEVRGGATWAGFIYETYGWIDTRGKD